MNVGRLSVFLVEDEVLIRMMLKDMVEGLGHVVTAEAGHLRQALAITNTATFDIAILDVNLGHENSVPVGEVIAARGIPFVVCTAYGIETASELFGPRPVIQKPLTPSQLQAIIDRAIAGISR
jgi:CheY-like chemotaxis protein